MSVNCDFGHRRPGKDLTVATEEGTSNCIVRPYRGVSALDRIAARRRRLLDAGLELFGTRGIATVGVGEVCAEAGLTKRYFYESFPSIEALAEAVFEDVRAGIAARVAPAIMEGGAANARPAIDCYVRAVTEDPRVLRLLAFETSQGPLARYRDSFATRAVETWFSLTAPQTADRDRTRLRAYAFVGASTQVGLAWASGEVRLTIEELIDELVELFESLATSGRK
jgi:AcrR family transcriptional regulator